MYLDDDNLSAGLLLQQPLDVLALAYQPQQGTLGNKFNCILKSNDNVYTIRNISIRYTGRHLELHK